MEYLIIFIIALLLVLLSGFLFYINIKKKYKNIFIKKMAEFEEEKAKFEEEEEESINKIIEEVKILDDSLANQINKVREMNTVAFECPCTHNIVSVFVDLSKDENTFICPECKNEYRIEISMLPILKGKIIDEINMYNLLSDKLKKPFIDNNE